MIKKKDRMYNYGSDQSVRVVWFWDPNQKWSFSKITKKSYKFSKFWKPLRTETTILFLKWRVVIEQLTSLLPHSKRKPRSK